jgi:septal ring factor EnvC (AmiA/AmiB activator)
VEVSAQKKAQELEPASGAALAPSDTSGMRKEERSKLRKAFERHLKKKQNKKHTHTQEAQGYG